MSRPVERRYGNGISDLPEDDKSLYTGIVVNGRWPRVRETDQWQPVARVRCAGCAIVAVIAAVMRNGRPELLAVNAQVVTDAEARPVRTQTVRYEVGMNQDLVAACPAHGVVRVRGEECVAAAQRGLVEVAQGATVTHVIHAHPESAVQTENA